MARRSALRSLSAGEQAAILTALLAAHPELAAEAEKLAARSLEREDRDPMAEAAAYDLRVLHLRDLADRAGRQWGGGYVDPHEAADELLAEALRPYLDDLGRRVAVGARDAAQEIGFGLLMGLYSCREEDDNDLVLTHAGMPDAVDNLGSEVIRAMRKGGLELPGEWLAEECPDWVR